MSVFNSIKNQPIYEPPPMPQIKHRIRQIRTVKSAGIEMIAIAVFDAAVNKLQREGWLLVRRDIISVNSSTEPVFLFAELEKYIDDEE